MDLWPVSFLVWILLIPLELASPFVLSGVGTFTAQSPFIMMLLRISGPLPTNLSLDNALAGSLMPLLVPRGNWWGFFPGVTWVCCRCSAHFQLRVTLWSVLTNTRAFFSGMRTADLGVFCHPHRTSRTNHVVM